MTFSKVLIANRGEIALRILRACEEADLVAVTVYSDADAEAAHVHEAPQSVRLGPAAPSESYLNVAAILDAARQTGADAIHPGYGFLSENADFARQVRDAGLTFIGPTPEVIDLMGRKDRAAEIAERAGVPLTPRYQPDAIPADVYPVLVKAAAGGGGKGMRIVREPADLDDALAAAGREARSAFGDDTLLVEKFIERGRHVEVQVFGDTHGHVVHLFTRDCTAQRRHQKVVEEAPAPDLSDTLRNRLHEASVALCREVGYTNAGTVEFLVDGEEAYFLEMNTRLQVEHPVTEEITGLDLVQWQFAVAAGHPLPCAQEEITATGHAVEVRVYAEDPYAGFLPQAGRIAIVEWPWDHRVETAIHGPGTVSATYDPMLAKIVAHGADRSAALAELTTALDATTVFGIRHNVGFLRRLINHDAFTQLSLHTAWLDSDDAAELLTAPPFPDIVGRAAAAAVTRGVDPDRFYGGENPDALNAGPFGILDGWRLGGPPAPTLVTFTLDGADHTFEAADDPAVFVAPDEHGVWFAPGGPADPVLPRRPRNGAWAAFRGHTWRLDDPDPFQSRAVDAAGDAEVTAPMPGSVLVVEVAEGDTVTSGQRLGIMEAMKMELPLTAPYDGTVSAVGAVAGTQVPLGAVLFTVDPTG